MEILGRVWKTRSGALAWKANAQWRPIADTSVVRATRPPRSSGSAVRRARGGVRPPDKIIVKATTSIDEIKLREEILADVPDPFRRNNETIVLIY